MFCIGRQQTLTRFRRAFTLCSFRSRIKYFNIPAAATVVNVIWVTTTTAANDALMEQHSKPGDDYKIDDAGCRFAPLRPLPLPTTQQQRCGMDGSVATCTGRCLT